MAGGVTVLHHGERDAAAPRGAGPSSLSTAISTVSATLVNALGAVGRHQSILAFFLASIITKSLWQGNSSTTTGAASISSAIMVSGARG